MSALSSGNGGRDLLAVDVAGCRKVLVKTGSGQEAIIKYQNQDNFGKWAEVIPDFVADDFKQAVDWILSNFN
jgi:hypothetical protein